MNIRFDNPLELLIMGPLDDYALTEVGISLMPDCPRTEMLDMLNNLRNRYLENPQKTIVSHWWKQSTERFQEKMNEELSFMLSEKDLTKETRQLRVLEALLNMRMKFLGG